MGATELELKLLARAQPETRVIGVEGLVRFRKDLRAIEKALPKELQRILKDAATQVAGTARGIYAEFYPRPWSTRASTGKSARGIRPRATATSASVALLLVSRPWLRGQEFGSNKPQFRQFRPWTGSSPGGAGGSSGRFLYPAIRREAPVIMKQTGEKLDALARRAFPDR